MFESSSQKSSPIPRSRSEFCYVSLTPKEKRRTTDFSHLLPPFCRDMPYARLLDPKSPVMQQPANGHFVVQDDKTKSCTVSNPNTVTTTTIPEVVRSQSMRSLRRSIDSSPTKYCQLKQHPELTVNELTSSSFGRIPASVEEEESQDFYRLRNFSLTSKGLVNWGDSFRSKSMSFVPSSHITSQGNEASSSLPVTNHLPRSATDCVSGSTSGQIFPSKHRVAILGSSEVGKTTLIQQFKTSEYICAFDNNDENNDSTLTVVLNGEESELEFIENNSLEYLSEEDETAEGKCDETTTVLEADAHVVVYSVTSRYSFQHASTVLYKIHDSAPDMTAVLVVGNKSDLVRTRAITTDEGRTLAKDLGCKFIETSVAINHQVDELLVSILTQIRTKHHMNAAAIARSNYPQISFTRAKCLIKKFLKKACFQSKSCDNLQRL